MAGKNYNYDMYSSQGKKTNKLYGNLFKEPMEMLNPNLNFGTMLHLLFLRNCVGDHHGLEAGIVDA